jgi:hypothetical protein
MTDRLESLVRKAIQQSPWDAGNKVLYDFCASNPRHEEVPVVLAKVWLIGRAYAAAIERRRNKIDQNDDFYVNEVAPIIIESSIDTWISAAAHFKEPDSSSQHAVLTAHANLTALFKQITNLEKRSLASKYLHFHLPKVVYIFDSRAVKGMLFAELT